MLDLDTHIKQYHNRLNTTIAIELISSKTGTKEIFELGKLRILGGVVHTCVVAASTQGMATKGPRPALG